MRRPSTTVVADAVAAADAFVDGALASSEAAALFGPIPFAGFPLAAGA